MALANPATELSDQKSMKRQPPEAFDAAIAQDIASILLAGPPSPAWQSFVAAAHDAGKSLPPVIKIDLIQDVIEGHLVHEAIAWLFGDGAPPTVNVESVSVAENSPIAASFLITSLSIRATTTSPTTISLTPAGTATSR